MGFSADCGGKLINYASAKQVLQRLQEIAADQFIYGYQEYFNWNNINVAESETTWGFEVQGHRLIFDINTNKYNFSSEPLPQNMSFPLTTEIGQQMFQFTPIETFQTQLDLTNVVQSLRTQFNQIYKRQDFYITIPNIPFFGTITEEQSRNPQFSRILTESRYLDDKLLVQTEFYQKFLQNYRQRRGKDIDAKVPIYKDKNTDLETSSYLQPYPGYIYLDSPLFGAIACLQCTFQAKGVDQSLFLNDNLHILSPLFLALTAGTPIIKGKLSNQDCRWNTMSQCRDDRSEQEMNPNSPQYQPRSRYSGISHYSSGNQKNRPQYSDVPVKINQAIVERVRKNLQQKGLKMPESLIKHLGINFSRQHIYIFDKFVQMKQQDQVVFEYFNRSLYDSVRHKIPMNYEAGWRSQFRTMQVQLTSDENAAWCILVYLMVQILKFVPNLNFYLPISKVDQNFKRAHTINGIVTQKFWFRTNIFDSGEAIVKQLTLNQIFFGSQQDKFTGLIPTLIDALANTTIFSQKLTRSTTIFEAAFKFLKKKVTGQLPTLAKWIRDFVTTHKQYKFDSIVNETISQDLLTALIKRRTRGNVQDPCFAPVFDY